MLVKGQSQRLPGKNKKDFKGKPMFMWNLEKCLKLFPKVFVSSDDPEVLEMAWHAGAVVISRPEELCGDTPNIPVYQHALQNMGDVGGIVAVQACSPGLDINLIAIAQHMMELGVDELMTVHPKSKARDYHNQHWDIYGSIWGISAEKLRNYKNAYKPEPHVLLEDPSIDIHTQEDFDKALELNNN